MVHCLLFLHLVNGATGKEASNIQWYRTAQNTTDRISRLPDLPFGEDFPSDAVVVVDR